MKTVATHNNGFHADDCFAVASLELVFGKLNIVRTRDEELIKKADVVVDVGCIYNEETLRFDHHQEGGAGTRENGIPFASFGLVWKKFGQEICGQSDLAEIVDKRLVSPIDALDNGFGLSTPKYQDVSNYELSSVIGAMNPTFLEKDISPDSIFPKAVEFAKEIIQREIASAKATLFGEKLFVDSFSKSEDKRCVVMDTEVGKSSWQSIVYKLPESLLFVVHPYGEVWALRAIRKDLSSFENRKDLPSSWAGKRDGDFEEVSGVKGAMFCHNKRFLAVAVSKESALLLLKKALDE